MKVIMNSKDFIMRPICGALAAFGGVQIDEFSDGHGGADAFHVSMRATAEALMRLAVALPLQFTDKRSSAMRGLEIVLIIHGVSGDGRFDVVLESVPLSVEKDREIRRVAIAKIADHVINGAKQ